jgi:uncharacterized protein
VPEKVICSNSYLLSLDENMNARYPTALGVNWCPQHEQDKIRAGQKVWIKTRDECRTNEKCLLASYENRLKEIHGDTSVYTTDTSTGLNGIYRASGVPWVNIKCNTDPTVGKCFDYLKISGTETEINYELSACDGSFTESRDSGVVKKLNATHFQGSLDVMGKENFACKIDLNIDSIQIKFSHSGECDNKMAYGSLGPPENIFLKTSKVKMVLRPVYP